jgi:DNA-binding GntR family transcriptional regulator
VQYSQIEIIPVAFNQLHAKSLHVSPGTPATLITRISYDKDGKVVEFDKEYWVSDVLKIQMRTLDKP